MDEVSSIVKMLAGQEVATMTASQQLEVLGNMAVRLQNLKRKVSIAFGCYAIAMVISVNNKLFLQLDQSSQEENADALRCHARLLHLQKLGIPGKDEVIDWNRKRLDILLADHMLHCGQYQSAEALTSESHIEASNAIAKRHYISLQYRTASAGVLLRSN